MRTLDISREMRKFSTVLTNLTEHMARPNGGRNNNRRRRVSPHARVGLQEARELFSRFIERVGFGGERIVFTRHGKDFVALVSLDDLNRLDAIGAPKAGTTVAALEANAPTDRTG